MNKTGKILTGFIGSTTLGMILHLLFSRKPTIVKSANLLTKAIDRKLEHDKKTLEETKAVLEQQLAAVNARIEQLNQS